MTPGALLARPSAAGHDRPVVVSASARRLGPAFSVGIGRTGPARASVPVLARGAARNTRIALSLRNHRAAPGGITRAGCARPSAAGQLGVESFIARARLRGPAGAHRVARAGLARVTVPVLVRVAVRDARRHVAAGARGTCGAIRARPVLEVLVFRARLRQADVTLRFVSAGNHRPGARPEGAGAAARALVLFGVHVRAARARRRRRIRARRADRARHALAAG